MIGKNAFTSTDNHGDNTVVFSLIMDKNTDSKIIELLNSQCDVNDFLKSLLYDYLNRGVFNLQAFAEDETEELPKPLDELMQDNVEQLKKVSSNIEYLQKLERGFKQIEAGKGVRHELIED